MKFAYLYYPVILVTAANLCGCKKLVEIDPPINQITASTVFSNDAVAIGTITGLYSTMAPNGTSATTAYIFNGGTTVYTGMAADEIINTTPNTTYDPFAKNTLVATNNTVTNFWNNAYQYIVQTNTVLEALSGATGVTAATKQQLTGEAKFLRAFTYFYLVNLYGQVPIVTGTNYQNNAILPRTGVDSIYALIVADLRDAQNLLQSVYPTSTPIRANKWAATALLARVYLYRKQWADAEFQASSVINSGSYTLENSLSNIFLVGSKEAIWQLQPVSTLYNTLEGGAFVPTSNTVLPNFSVTSFLMNAFEPTDLRKTTWTNSNTVSGTTYYYPFKYRIQNSPTLSENCMMLRLTEMYLIRAEAKAQQGTDLSGAEADLKLIRDRATLPTTASSQPDLLTAIAHENQIEFCFEWGHRWFDLKRTGTIDQVLGSEKPSWQAFQVLFPIPNSEVLNDPFLTQNTGY